MTGICAQTVCVLAGFTVCNDWESFTDYLLYHHRFRCRLIHWSVRTTRAFFGDRKRELQIKQWLKTDGWTDGSVKFIPVHNLWLANQWVGFCSYRPQRGSVQFQLSSCLELPIILHRKSSLRAAHWLFIASCYTKVVRLGHAVHGRYKQHLPLGFTLSVAHASVLDVCSLFTADDRKCIFHVRHKYVFDFCVCACCHSVCVCVC